MNNEKSAPYEFSFDEKKLCYELFTLRNNKRSKEMMKFDIKKEKSSFSFMMADKKKQILFSVGGNDIIIMKKAGDSDHNRNLKKR